MEKKLRDAVREYRREDYLLEVRLVARISSTAPFLTLKASSAPLLLLMEYFEANMLEKLSAWQDMSGYSSYDACKRY